MNEKGLVKLLKMQIRTRSKFFDPIEDFISDRVITSPASITVPTPTVSACVGTWLISPSKNLALA